MMLRIIHGKLKPGTWNSYERTYEIHEKSFARFRD